MLYEEIGPMTANIYHQYIVLQEENGLGAKNKNIKKMHIYCRCIQHLSSNLDYFGTRYFIKQIIVHTHDGALKFNRIMSIKYNI